MKKSKTREDIDETQQEALNSLETFDLEDAFSEIIKVRIRFYKEETIIDDDGNALLDSHDNPLKTRKMHTRTAYIHNFIPLPIYQKLLKEKENLRAAKESSRIEIMTDFVFQVWKITEPWMTKEQLTEGIGIEAIAALFTRFIKTTNRQERLP